MPSTLNSVISNHKENHNGLNFNPLPNVRNSRPRGLDAEQITQTQERTRTKMSAYLVTENHIEYLVDALTNPRNDLTAYIQHTAETADPQEVGQILWDENARSVNYRYKETESAPPFTYRRKCYATDPLQVLASIRCYNYQTCETPDYDETKAGKLIHRLQSAIISRITTDKTWGAPEPEANQIRLSCLAKR